MWRFAEKHAITWNLNAAIYGGLNLQVFAKRASVEVELAWGKPKTRLATLYRAFKEFRKGNVELYRDGEQRQYRGIVSTAF